MISNVVKHLIIAAWNAVCAAGKIELARSADINGDEPYFEDRSLDFLAQRANELHMDIIRVQQYVEQTEGLDVVHRPVLRYESSREYEVSQLKDGAWEPRSMAPIYSIESARARLVMYRDQNPENVYTIFESIATRSTTSIQLNF